jgi:transposase
MIRFPSIIANFFSESYIVKLVRENRRLREDLKQLSRELDLAEREKEAKKRLARGYQKRYKARRNVLKCLGLPKARGPVVTQEACAKVESLRKKLKK